VQATAGIRSATVTWTAAEAPADGGAVQYQVTPIQGSSRLSPRSVSPGTLQLQISELLNGTTYTFEVVASNSAGNGPAAVSGSVTTPDVPAAPTDVTATPNMNGGVTVSWTAPASGDYPVTSYQVSHNHGGSISVEANSTSTDFSDLIAGTTYTFSVVAVNAVGSSTAATSSPLTTRTVPGAPTDVTATAANGSAIVTWTAPAQTGGTNITAYTVVVNPGGAQVSTPDVTTWVVKGLTNGASYKFTVFATNTQGDGPESLPSNAVTPAAPPDAPVAATAVARSLGAIVSWSEPMKTNGAPITSYTVTATPGGATKTTTSAPVKFSGLTAGTSYTFTVLATNAAGDSEESDPSSAVTALGAPDAAQSTVTLDTSSVPADGATAIHLVATLADSAGQLLEDEPVAISLSGLGGAATPDIGTTNANGELASSITSTLPGARTITVTSGALTLTKNVTFSIAACTGTSGFSAGSSFGAPTTPAVVLLNDVDGDTFLDLIVAGGSVVVYRGQGTGAFAAQGDTYALSATAKDGVLGDFNGDGLEDIVLAQDGGVSVLLAKGDGTFEAAVTSTAAGNSQRMVAGDFNGDGKRDVALIHWASGTISTSVEVLFGAGNGTFTQQPLTTLSGTPFRLATADFNGDGYLDLAVGLTSDNVVQIFDGNGDGTFQSPRSIGVPFAGEIATGDFNGDGKPDFAVTSFSSGAWTLQVHLGNGDGTFQTAIPRTLVGGFSRLIATDLDYDGKLDIVGAGTVQTDTGIVALLGNGDGTLDAGVSYTSSSYHLGSLAAGDLNGDGRPEIVGGSNNAASYWTFANTCTP
jgi:hypothetical protein